MRPSFAFVLFLSVFLTLGAMFWWSQHQHGTANVSDVSAAGASTSEASAVPAVSGTAAEFPAEPPLTPVSPAPVPSNAVTPEQHQMNIEAETDRLQQLSMSDDPISLSNILADLTSPEKEIRAAAIEATKQFGSTNAIPALKAAAEASEDHEEKAAFLEAVDFLSLPSLDTVTMSPPETSK